MAGFPKNLRAPRSRSLVVESELKLLLLAEQRDHLLGPFAIRLALLNRALAGEYALLAGIEILHLHDVGLAPGIQFEGDHHMRTALRGDTTFLKNRIPRHLHD